jgi:hypothetical protein
MHRRQGKERWKTRPELEEFHAELLDERTGIDLEFRLRTDETLESCASILIVWAAVTRNELPSQDQGLRPVVQEASTQRHQQMPT